MTEIQIPTKIRLKEFGLARQRKPSILFSWNKCVTHYLRTMTKHRQNKSFTKKLKVCETQRKPYYVRVLHTIHKQLRNADKTKVLLENWKYAKLENHATNCIVWSKMIRNCHYIREEKLQKNRCQRHFVAQSILDKHWKFQPDSSNGTPARSDHAKAVAWTLTQLAANRLRAARRVTLMSNECWSVLELSIRCRDSA